MSFTVYVPKIGASKLPELKPGRARLSKGGDVAFCPDDLRRIGVELGKQQIVALVDALGKRIGFRAPREGEAAIKLNSMGKTGPRRAPFGHFGGALKAIGVDPNAFAGELDAVINKADGVIVLSFVAPSGKSKAAK